MTVVAGILCEGAEYYLIRLEYGRVEADTQKEDGKSRFCDSTENA